MKSPQNMEDSFMPKRITPLSEVKVRTAKPQGKEYKIFDGGGYSFRSHLRAGNYGI